MAIADNTVELQQSANTDNAFKGVWSVENTLIGLFRKAEDRLNREELESLSRLGEFADLHLSQIEHTVNSLGNLIATSDAEVTKCDAMQNADDVSRLLFMLGNSIDTVQGLLFISADAKSMLSDDYVIQRANAGSN